MSRVAVFHAQLTSIMEALTRTAVAEICELLDDSYAVLQLEIRRSHTENRALRRKLELIESVVALGHRGDGTAREAAATTGGVLTDFTVGECRCLRPETGQNNKPNRFLLVKNVDTKVRTW